MWSAKKRAKRVPNDIHRLSVPLSLKPIATSINLPFQNIRIEFVEIVAAKKSKKTSQNRYKFNTWLMKQTSDCMLGWRIAMTSAETVNAAVPMGSPKHKQVLLCPPRGWGRWRKSIISVLSHWATMLLQLHVITLVLTWSLWILLSDHWMLTI